jgi:hypothetical protein
MSPSNSKWHWHKCIKTHRHVCVNNQILQLLRGGIDQWGVGCDNSFLWLELHRRQQILELHKIGGVNLFTLCW